MWLLQSKLEGRNKMIMIGRGREGPERERRKGRKKGGTSIRYGRDRKEVQRVRKRNRNM